MTTPITEAIETGSEKEEVEMSQYSVKTNNFPFLLSFLQFNIT